MNTKMYLHREKKEKEKKQNNNNSNLCACGASDFSTNLQKNIHGT